MRNPTPNAAALIESFEKRCMRVYNDSGKPPVPTGGVGHTGRDVPPVGTELSPAQVDAWFAGDILEAVQTIARHVPQQVFDAIPDESYDALVSFVFNVGEQAFVDPRTGKQTNFAKTLCACQWDKVDDRMRDWVYDGGVKVNGLVNRRSVEAQHWSMGFDTTMKPEVKQSAVTSSIAAVAAMPPRPETTGLVPSAPPKAQVFGAKSVTGFVTAAVGALASNAGDLVDTGSQLRMLAGDIRVISAVGGVLVAGGVLLLLWEKLHARRNSGA